MEIGKPAPEILVTGATGFVGPHLVSALAARGDRVRILALPDEDTNHVTQPQVSIYRGDVREPQSLAAAFAAVDTVINLAAAHGLWLPKQQYYDVNVRGTENICRAALAAGVRRLVHMSTWTVYGFGLGRPVREDSPLIPVADLYQSTKLEADEIVQRHIAQNNLPATIIRPATIFGPGDRINFSRLADRIRSGKAIIIGTGRNALPIVYISDLIEGLMLAAFQKTATGQIYNISNDQPLTQEEMGRAIAAEIGVNPPTLRVPYHLLYGLAAIAEKVVGRDNPKRQPLVTRYGVQLFGTDNRLSIEKARRELGYAPRVSVRDGVRITADWYLKQQASPISGAQAVPARNEVG